MARRWSTSPLDHDPDERLTFADMTLLAFLAVSTVAVLAVLILGTASAFHRIAAALGAP